MSINIIKSKVTFHSWFSFSISLKIAHELKATFEQICGKPEH